MVGGGKVNFGDKMSNKREFVSRDYNIVKIPAETNSNARKQYVTGRHLAIMPQSASSPEVLIQFGEGAPDKDKAVRVFAGDSFSFEENLTAFYIWIVPTSPQPGDQIVILIGNKEIKFNPSPQIIREFNDEQLRNDFFGAGLESLASANSFFNQDRYKINGGASTRLAFSFNTTGAPEKQQYMRGVEGMRTMYKQSGDVLTVPVSAACGLYSAYLVDASKTGSERFIKYSQEEGGYANDSLIWMEMDMRGNFNEAIWIFGWQLFNNPDDKPAPNQAFEAFVNRRNFSATAQALGMNGIPDSVAQHVGSFPFHQGGMKLETNNDLAYLKTIMPIRQQTTSSYDQQATTFFVLPERERRVEQAFIDNVGRSIVTNNSPTLGLTLQCNWYYPQKAVASVNDGASRIMDMRVIAYIANAKYIENYFSDINRAT